MALIYLGIIGISKLILGLVDKINFGILDEDIWVTFFWDIAIYPLPVYSISKSK